MEHVANYTGILAIDSAVGHAYEFEMSLCLNSNTVDYVLNQTLNGVGYPVNGYAYPYIGGDSFAAPYSGATNIRTHVPSGLYGPTEPAPIYRQYFWNPLASDGEHCCRYIPATTSMVGTSTIMATQPSVVCKSVSELFMWFKY